MWEPIDAYLRIAAYKMLGMSINNKAIWPGCHFDGNNISIGEGTWVNRGCFFDNDIARIEIGQNCGIGMEVMFCTSSHAIGTEIKRAAENLKLPIIIGDGCWIGVRSVILPGVKVGCGCVIAAGSVVNKDCTPNGLYGGVPARRIKELD